MKSSNKNPRHKKATPVTKNKSSWWILGIIIIGVAIGIIWWKNTSKPNTSNPTTTSSPQNTPVNPDKDLLIGRWARTDSDGAYVIEIKSAGANGKLDAQYFNPNPIKVGFAEWKKKNNGLMITVELRDLNYPGSTYTLNFIPNENQMTGNYYQAVEGTNFDVTFVRVR